MKKLPFGISKIIVVVTISILLITIVLPFDLFNMEQAHRIAKWKSTYEKLKYSFSLAQLNGDTKFETNGDTNIIDEESYIISKLAPYFNLETDEYTIQPKYKYRKMNGRRLEKNSQFKFDHFVKRKDGVFIGLNKNLLKTSNDDNLPNYIMFVDINGNEKPNMIGKDIFFINVYKDSIHALGSGKEHSQLKANCSPVGGGLYCSEYYLLGGNF